MGVASSDLRERVARAGFAAFNAGDTGTVVELLSDDVEVFSSPELANAGTFRGRDGYLEWIAPWVEAWRSLDLEVKDVTVVGGRHVVTEIHQMAEGRGGIEVAMDVAFLFDVGDDGLIDYLALLPSAEQALRLARQREAGSS
jgi:ketosteroid isomerase-like protein